MIIELPVEIDFEGLKNYLKTVQKNYPPFMKKNGPWGGWSITSSSGEVYDGWQAGEKVNDETLTPDDKNYLKEFFSTLVFNKPTPIYDKFMDTFLSDLKKSLPDLELSRIRLAVLKPHPENSAYWHIDGETPGPGKAFRLHIPIITNHQCFFEYQDQKTHLLADGKVYLVDVSIMHRATNLSNEDRIHLIADIRKN